MRSASCLLLFSWFVSAAPLIAAAPPTSAPSIARMPPPGELATCLRLIREKQYDAARARLEPIVAAHPRWARATFMLALTYHEEQRYEMAEPLFARALEIEPREIAVRPFFGWCLYYLGKPTKSREQFEKFLEAKPNYADAHFAIGLIEYDADRLDQAMERFNKTIDLARLAREPRTEGKARARLADVHIRRNELAKARDELLKAVELRPDAYEAYFKLSRVYDRLGDRERAEWARKMHETVRDQMHPTAPPMGGPASRPAGGATREP